MKYLLPFLATISCLAAQAQKNNPARSKQIFIGFNFSPDYDFRTLKNNGGGSSGDPVIRTRNNMEIGKFGYTTGLNVCVSFTKLVGLEAGVQYSNKGYQTRKQEFFYLPPDPALPATVKFMYSYHYIDVPLKVNLTFGKSKVRFFSSAGITTNFFLKEVVASVYGYSGGRNEKKREPTTFDYKKLNISPMISAGAEYKIKDKMYLRIEPTFRYGILKIIDTPVTGYLWNIGINTGFYFGF